MIASPGYFLTRRELPGVGMFGVLAALTAIALTVAVTQLATARVEGGLRSILADESDSPTLRVALAGVDTVFLVPVRERPDRVAVHRGAAVAAGVRHIVYSSFLSAAPDATFTWARDHYATEEHIRSTGVPFTFLRGSVYLEVLHHAVGPDQTIHAPGGDGRFAPVAREDMARVAAAVLASPAAHTGQTYDITGPTTISFAELAQAFTAARGTPVGYADQDVTEALALARASGMPEWQAQGWVSALHQVSIGELDIVSGTVRTLTGRRPVSLAEFLGQHSRPPGENLTSQGRAR